MNVFEQLADWRAFRRRLDVGNLGFVPTMGALHDGHRSLIEASVSGNDHTVVSVFVNPTQFDREADLQAYPRCQAEDLAALESWGVDSVLRPDYAQLYRDGYRYRVTENDLSSRWCGAHRPGHFDGVLTVVLRLFNLVRPDRAYFGEKDYQQLLLVQGMVDAFFLDVEVIACPIVREADGLALSSRNRRLDARQRGLAPRLHRALRRSASPGEAIERLRRAGFAVDYVEDYRGRRLGAASLGDVRLIDNVALGDGCDG